MQQFLGLAGIRHLHQLLHKCLVLFCHICINL